MATDLTPGTYLFASVDHAKVYGGPSLTAGLYGYQPKNTHTNRDFQQFEPIGQYSHEVVGEGGATFLLVIQPTYDTDWLGIWSIKFRPCFVPKVGGDWLDEVGLTAARKEKDRAEFERNLTDVDYPKWALLGIPKPASITYKKDPKDGQEKLYLVWANGYTETYDIFSQLASSVQKTFTTAAPKTTDDVPKKTPDVDPPKKGLLAGLGADGNSTSLYVILAGVSFFIVVGVYLVVNRAKRLAQAH